MIAAWEIAAVVGGVLGAAAWTWARKRGWGDRWDHPWTLDLALIVAGLALNLPALIGLWGLLSPYRSPMGPDSDANFLAAVALERGDLALYAGDRYPAYPGLVGALAPQASGLADTGRQFTPYALVAAADLLAVLSLLALVRGHRVATIPLALAAAVAFTAAARASGCPAMCPPPTRSLRCPRSKMPPSPWVTAGRGCRCAPTTAACTGGRATGGRS